MQTIKRHLARHLHDDNVSSLWCLVYAGASVGAYLAVLRVIF